MNRNDEPKKQPVPFGINGQREAIIPDTPSGDNSASYEKGFPPITMVLKAAGGLPPKGQDMNQILYELSNLLRWFSAGALNTFDADFNEGIGGYPKGAVILGNDAETIFINRLNGNKSNPNTTPTNWFNLSTGYLKTASNLSEIATAGPAAVASAVDNLGLTEAAAAAANALKKSANLSDLIDKPLARSNLGVTAASLTNAGLVRLSDNVGSTDTTLAATINSVTYTFGQAQSKMSKGSNGADIPDKAAFRLALQLGAAALLGVGTRDDIPAGSTSLLATMDCLASLIPKRSYSANDYIRIPDVPRGLMIQWGYFSSGQGVNFPTPFSVDCLTVLQIPQSADTGAHGLIYHQTLSFNAQGFLRNAAASSVPCRWIAIGY
ncbi:phage tail protein [Yersinia ruckeri]|nr:tail fiber protein [Yersinia ruckeri]MCW6592942.1 phage tail protein [Yersinia ruckeri]UIN14998.1 phage tail protein [Yersinia ruckeri]UIN18377.1 phage tail protein [Yersinia ruckeri]UZY09083.1 phage tail protein [Yersinia ruckeri]